MPIDGVVEQRPRHSSQMEGQADGPITGAIDRWPAQKSAPVNYYTWRAE